MEKCSVMTTDGSIMPAWLGGTGWGKVGGGAGKEGRERGRDMIRQGCGVILV